jgi:hypothetical protein
MWRANREGEDEEVDFSVGILKTFDDLLVSESTPLRQHFAAIESICQRFEAAGRLFGHVEISSGTQQLLSTLRDPCVQFIACRVLGIAYPDDYRKVAQENRTLEKYEESWERTQSFIVKDLASNAPTLVLDLSASFWGIWSAAHKKKWCQKAQTDPTRIVSIPIASQFDNILIRSRSTLNIEAVLRTSTTTMSSRAFGLTCWKQV